MEVSANGFGIGKNIEQVSVTIDLIYEETF